MIHSSPLRVKAAVREQHDATRQIPFAFRADPTGLDELRLDATARSTFVLILDNARLRGWRSRLSNATMGRILGRCPMTISRALGRLESAGLIRRDLIAGGRVRTGIVVTWEGVRRESLTGQASVRREDLTGSAHESNGVRRGDLTNQSSTQSEDQTAVFIPPGKEPGEVPDGPTAAAFLRAMIAKGRQETPVPATMRSQPGERLVTAQALAENPPAPPSAPRLDDPRREVRVMLDQLSHGFAEGPSGPRRLSPAQLQRQLAELRRKYGGRSRA